MTTKGDAEETIGPNDLGKFVWTRALGIGRLIDLTTDGARVRYFQAPGRCRRLDVRQRRASTRRLDSGEQSLVPPR